MVCPEAQLYLYLSYLMLYCYLSEVGESHVDKNRRNIFFFFSRDCQSDPAIFMQLNIYSRFYFLLDIVEMSLI